MSRASVNIIFYDGKCKMCHSAVKFILKYDTAALFNFASLHSESAKRYLFQPFPESQALDSIVLLKGNRIYTHSSAFIQICLQIKRLKLLGYLLQLFPRKLRDFIYSYIAANRFRWMGVQKSCILLSPEQQLRFMD